MEIDKRRKAIQSWLESSNSPIKGNQLAEKFDVSRQVIVQDIALLRAAGTQVVATPSGYLIQNIPSHGILKTICCLHNENLEEIKMELESIISYGGRVIDTVVEHPVYGEIRVVLNLTCLNDIQSFLEKIETSQAKLLSTLTEGVHYHTLEVPNEIVFEKIVEELKEKEILKIESSKET